MLKLEPRRPGEIDHERLWAAIGLVGLVALWAFPWWRDLPGPRCMMKTLTGIPCPGCGGTRSLAAWARLRFLEAARWNPLAAVGAVVFSFYWVYAVGAVVLRPARRLRLNFPEGRAGAALRVGFVVAIVVNWIYLIWDGR